PRPAPLDSFPTRRSSDLPSSVDRISVNRPATLGGDDAKRALQGCLRDSLSPVIAVDEEARNPPVGWSLIQLAVPAHSARELDWGDRKSTRLNSSHLVISY